MKKFLLLVFMLGLSLCVSEVWAQTRTISGTVTSADDGSTLPGVNVVLKGTTVGTVTSIDGKYTLSVPADGGTLVFSFVGLASQEVEIGTQSVINLQMVQDVTELSEVIVTGYGVEQKRDLTGSVASIKSDVIQDLPMQSFDRAMQGRAAGVQISSGSGQPGGAINVIVRGYSSLADNTPLYIVDGVQVNTGGIAGGGSTNALAGINPNDIESIDVLKDAAASAIYGAQAANGVVIITTKRGKKNQTNLNFGYQRGWVKPQNLYDVMNAQQFAEIKEEAYLNNPARDVNDAYAQFGNPNDPSSLTPEDWVDRMFRTGDIEIYNLTLSGGNEATQFYVSASYESQEGQVIQSEWDRANVRMNIDHNFNQKIRVSSQLSLARQHSFGAIEGGNFVNGPFQSAFVSQPNSPAIDPETGEYNPYPAHLPETGAGHNFNYNILQGVNLERREAYTVQSLASMTISYKILPSLTAQAFGGLDFQDSQSINERPATIPAFAALNGQTSVTNARYLNYNLNGTLSYNEKFGDHSVSVIGGYEFKEEIVTTEAATGRGYASPEFRLLGQAATPFSVGGTWTGYRRNSVFGKATYDYKNKYLINGTIRRDGNSRFGSNNKFGTFWAVGAAWRLTQEAFMDNVSLFDDLKLRASWGVLGNSNGIGNFSALGSYGGGAQYNGNPGQRPIRLENDLLSWEREEQITIGVDFAVLGSRLYGAVDFWRSDTDDQLFTIPLPSDSGFGGITGNAGSVRNQGIEIELGAVVVDAGGFKYTTDFNISFQENELTELPNGEERIGNDLIVGEPVNFVYGVPYAGVNPANGKAMWYDSLGNPVYRTQERDGRVLGSSIPKTFGGWAHNLSYKGITLEVFFQYSLDYKTFLGDLYNLAYAGATNDNQLVSQLDRWQEPGDITNVPIAVDGGQVDGFDQRFPGFAPSRFVDDGGYIRLKQVTLGYDLPISVLDRIGLKRFYVFAQALNLYTWTNYSGIDPEVIEYNNNAGISTYGTYPNGKQFTLGVNIGL
jgi:TonB-linked SusC/RagA family outer membrane protein